MKRKSFIPDDHKRYFIMDVLLVNPHGAALKECIPPLGLAYIAAYLREKGVKIEILDLVNLEIGIEEFRTIVSQKKPGIIGITSTTPQIRAAFELAAISKEELPDTQVVFGGVHSTVLPQESLQDMNVDVVVIGEGELTFMELVECLENDRPLSKVKGIAWKEDGRILINEPRPFIKDLDELPFPARDLLPMEKYASYFTGVPMASMITGRGCPYNCMFCASGAYWKNMPRFRSVKNVVDEIECIIEVFNIRFINFLDDTFTLKKQRVYDFCNELQKRGVDIRWHCNCRANTVDQEMLSKMKESGCTGIDMGVESGNEVMLKRIRKQITLEQIKTAFKVANNVGLNTHAFFMMGFPDETEETMRQSIDLAKEISPSTVDFRSVVPFPGTDLYNVALTHGKVLTKDWYYYDTNGIPIYIPEGLSQRLILKYIIKAEMELTNHPFRLLRVFLRNLKAKRIQEVNSETQIFDVIKFFGRSFSDWTMYKILGEDWYIQRFYNLRKKNYRNILTLENG